MVVWPWELGRSVIKSIAIWDQGRHGVGSGFSRPAGSCLGNLEVLHMVQLCTNLVVSVNSEGHQKRFLSRFAVALIPGWPELGEVWTWVISRGRRCSRTYVRSAGLSGGGGFWRFSCSISVMISHCTVLQESSQGLCYRCYQLYGTIDGAVSWKLRCFHLAECFGEITVFGGQVGVSCVLNGWRRWGGSGFGNLWETAFLTRSTPLKDLPLSPGYVRIMCVQPG